MPAMNDLVDFARALDFAAHKHTDQRRKGVRGEPYVNHVAEVARLVAEATGGRDRVAILAALLHDTLEDTDTTREELEREFGPEVASVVAEVTDDKRLRKAERKQRQVDGAASKSLQARLVKLADKTSNLRSMAASPPANWPQSQKREYFDWAKAVVDRMRGTHPGLESLFDTAYENGIRGLEGTG